jgi:uncharacterized protein DUF4276
MSRVALILVEGETEEEFYSLLIQQHCRSHPKQVKNLHGNFNINSKIVDESVKHTNNNPNRDFDVYVCIDQERLGYPAYNHALCESTLKKCPNFKRLIPVIAVLMCESLFFLDIDGIYKFLRAPKQARKPNNFKNYRKFTHHHLSKLFKTFGRSYQKGKRCQHFVSNLDLTKTLQAGEIQKLIATLQASAPKKRKD